MDRAIAHGSKLCAKREDQRRQDMHKERLRNIRKLVDTSTPHAISMDHVRNNLKKEQMLEERYSEIDRENHILLKKMSHIMGPQAEGSSSSQGCTPRLGEKRPPGPTSLNRDARKKELLRITKENQSILRRIQQAQPVVNHVELEGSHKRATSYLKNCVEHPLVLRTPRSARGQSSELVPLDQQPMPWRSARPSSLPPPQPQQRQQRQGQQQMLPPQQQQQPQNHFQLQEEFPEGQGLDEGARYVLKEGRRLGDTQFLIEMSTDAAGGLHICAFDGEAQQQLELPLSERAHRRLARETGGDYAAVAARLSIATDAAGGRRLALLDEGAGVSSFSAPAGAPAPRSSDELDANGMMAARPDTGVSAQAVDDMANTQNTFEGFSAQVDFETNADSQVRFRGLTASTEGGRS